MNLAKFQITENQKKIIILGGVVVFVFLLFWMFIFLPSSKEIRALKNELISTDQQIQAIEILLSGSQSRDEAIRLLKQRQQYLSNKFPDKEEESLRLIPDYARKMNITVVALQPGSKTELLDHAGKQIMIEGKVAYFLPISLEVSCYFRDLVKYALELKAALPAFTSINNLDIKREEPLNGKIRATIQFDLYLLI